MRLHSRRALAEKRAIIIPAGYRPGEVPAWPRKPVIEIWPGDARGHEGRVAPNLASRTTPSRNFLNQCTGDITNDTTGPTIADNYAVGPSGVGTTAAKITYTTTSQLFHPYRQTVLPAGNYRHQVKLQTDAGQGSQDIRTGRSSDILTPTTIGEGAWTTISYNHTADGVAQENFVVRGSGSNTPAVKIDEIWIDDDSDGSSVPDFQTDLAAHPFNWHLKKQPLGYRGSLAAAAGYINLSGGAAMGRLLAPEYPLTHSFTAGITASVLVRVASATGNVGYWLVHPNSSTWRLGVDTVGLPGYVPFTTSTSKTVLIAQGWVVMTQQLHNGRRTIWLNEHRLREDSAAYSTISMAMIHFGSLTAAANAPDGDFAGGVLFDAGDMTDDDIQQIVRGMWRRGRQRGIEKPARRNVMKSEGDSNTSPTGGTDAGEGWIRRLAETGVFIAGEAVWLTRNFAVSGSDLALYNSRLANTLDCIARSKADGVNVIIAVPVSYANDKPTIEASPSAFFANFKTYCNTLRQAGARVVVVSPTPVQIGEATANQEAARQTLMDLMEVDPGSYCDGYVDAGRHADIGNVANCNDGVFYMDTKHLKSAGQQVLADLAEPVVAALMV